MIKIWKRFSFPLAAVSLSRTASAQLRIVSAIFLCLSLQVKAEEACTGGWQFEQLKSCNLSCKTSEIDQKAYNACRAEVKDEAIGCGPEQYKSCPSMSCPGSVKGEVKMMGALPCETYGYKYLSRTPPVPSGPRLYICRTPDQPASCPSDTCGVERWKSCKHSSCPVDEKNSTYKCTAWNAGYADSCGTPAQSLTGRESPKPVNPEVDGRRAKDFYGTGSSCLTCNDVPLDSPVNVQARFECLAKGISLAEASSAGFTSSTTNDIFRNLQIIGLNYSFDLTAEQNLRLIDILSRYAIDE